MARSLVTGENNGNLNDVNDINDETGAPATDNVL